MLFRSIIEIPEAGVIERRLYVILKTFKNASLCRLATGDLYATFTYEWLAVWYESVCAHLGHGIGTIHVWPTGLQSSHLPRWHTMTLHFIRVNENHSASLLCFYEPSFSHKRPNIFSGHMCQGQGPQVIDSMTDLFEGFHREDL